MDYFNYQRHPTLEVHVGETVIGGEHPIVVQTMTNTDTLDTRRCVEQCERIIKAGAGLIRLTTQGVREAENLRPIRQALRDKGYTVPLSADVHFNPLAADAAAKIVEKVRINPGNFTGKKRVTGVMTHTDAEYAKGLERIRDKFIPFLRICRQHGTAVRIGVNHGSLSERIMSRYGDTPEGMVASCMEYLRIAVEEEFFDIVISLKSSNTLLMTKAVRLLVATMEREDMHFPLHLGVTEAGNGEEGRIKSAVGIGALLSDGIGDTIRVSLSEEPEAEVPVARKLLEYISLRKGHSPIAGTTFSGYDPFAPERRKSLSVRNIGGGMLPVVISDRSRSDNLSIDHRFIPDYIYVGDTVPRDFPKGMKAIVDFPSWRNEIDRFPLFGSIDMPMIRDCPAPVKFLRIAYPQLSEATIDFLRQTSNLVLLLFTDHPNGVGEQRAFFHALLQAGCPIPIVLQRSYAEDAAEDIQIKAGADFGTLLLDGFGDGVMLGNAGRIDLKEIDACAFGILQAARLRTSKTEFISCPGCGRTLFDLQTTVALVKRHFSHLKHLKIGVMGCIVNGPGEMADADYGYVGAGHGRISLYHRKEVVEKNIPQEEAVERLIRLIKANGDWIEPEGND